MVHPIERPCPNPHCEQGWVERRDDEPGGPPTVRCWVCAAKSATDGGGA